MEVEGRSTLLRAGSGIRVLPGTRHQISNPSSGPVRLLVISQPPSRGDPYALGPELEGRADGALHCAAECHTPYKLKSYIFSNQGGVEFGTAHFLDIDQDFPLETAL